MPGALRLSLGKAGRIALMDHRRQYWGTIVEGRRLLRVAFFCSAYDKDIDVHAKVHEVLDENGCVKHASLDIQRGAFVAPL